MYTPCEQAGLALLETVGNEFECGMREMRVGLQGVHHAGKAIPVEVKCRDAQLVMQDGAPLDRIGMLGTKEMFHLHGRNHKQFVSQ